jgi:hypothetical protein
VSHSPRDSLECMQVVSQYSSLLAPLAVDLRDIKVLRKLGGTVSLFILSVPHMLDSKREPTDCFYVLHV